MRRLNVEMMARVEGEGALDIEINERGEVGKVNLRIFEPPRFFEGFLRGRHFSEVPDIVARICGICPVAYQMSAVQALETLFGIELDPQLTALRRLMYCGEWIESHALHIYLLHAPDFFGLDSALELGARDPQKLHTGLRLKKIGDTILTILGGRAVHPVSVTVGGFSRVPEVAELQALTDDLTWGREAALDTIRWVAGLEFPDLRVDYRFVALQSDNEYAMNYGHLADSISGTLPITSFEQHSHESHLPHTTALHSHIDGTPYLVGPQARLALNGERLGDAARSALADFDLHLLTTNPHYSIVVRAIELLNCIDELLKIVEMYRRPKLAAMPFSVRAGTAMGGSEAPRGLLYHRYEVDGDGIIREAKIVPPTAQNQARIEADLRQLLPSILHLSDAAATFECERVIRCYDPCISCSVHFLKLKISRK